MQKSFALLEKSLILKLLNNNKQEKMTEIEKYVQFAIDNGYSGYDSTFKIGPLESYDEVVHGHFINSNNHTNKTNIIEEIISKPFIEAIARGLIKEDLWINIIGDLFSKDEYKKQMEEENKKNKKNKDITKTMYYITIVNIITTEQAVFIRDDKLDEFINNILPND